MRTTNTDILIQFASDHGHGLDEASRLARNRDPQYVEWLEDKVLERFVR